MGSETMTYTLIQHTPMIHFQYGMDGPTLRATEVKPKLDRYLLRRLGGADRVKQDHPDWFIGQTNALNYKLRFVGIGTPQISKTVNAAIQKLTDRRYRAQPDEIIPGMYFGNMANTRNGNLEERIAAIRGAYKESVFWSDGVEMSLVCFIPDLRNFIDECIADFFICTNFGTCQSKGYGSFTIENDIFSNSARIGEMKQIVANALIDCYGASNGLSKCYFYPTRLHPHGMYALKSIKPVYGMMKSGLNLRNQGYRRSLLFCYMHDRFNLGNEKSWMKQNRIAPIVVTSPHATSAQNSNHPQYYVRALMGIGETQSWLNNGGGRVTIRVENSFIERFPSPVFFKVIGNMVFFIGGRINGEIWGKNFTFSNAGATDSIPVPEYSEGVLDENFMDGFLDYCFNCWYRRPTPDESPLSAFADAPGSPDSPDRISRRGRSNIV